eukprot:TRINITY_DN45899_c0_g1_i1.p1 TRINITY_DN45899_c0_g1~~TRINITY_DN45899_c0_g1_i1.p1  ORF type:complete len:100 (-),score=38.29 TRINITY_DN45899_c0_g1_i1:73-372(-)
MCIRDRRTNKLCKDEGSNIVCNSETLLSDETFTVECLEDCAAAERSRSLGEVLGQGSEEALGQGSEGAVVLLLSLIHISEPTRLLSISYAVFCLKKKKK